MKTGNEWMLCVGTKRVPNSPGKTHFLLHTTGLQGAAGRVRSAALGTQRGVGGAARRKRKGSARTGGRVKGARREVVTNAAGRGAGPRGCERRGGGPSASIGGAGA